MKFKSFASGYKTYAACAIAVGLGVASYFGYHEPTWLDWVLGAFGLASARAGMKTEARNAAAAVGTVVKDVLSQITVAPPPDPNRGLTGAKVPTPPAVEVDVLNPVPGVKTE